MCSADIPLVNGPAPIPDSQITASSSWKLNHGPQYARLNNTAEAGAWCPGETEVNAPTPNMYIQVGIRLISRRQCILRTSHQRIISSTHQLLNNHAKYRTYYNKPHIVNAVCKIGKTVVRVV